MFFFFWTHCCWKLVFLFFSFVVVFVLFGTWRVTLSRVLFRWLVLEEFGLARKALFFWVYLVLFTILPDRTFFFYIALFVFCLMPVLFTYFSFLFIPLLLLFTFIRFRIRWWGGKRKEGVGSRSLLTFFFLKDICYLGSAFAPLMRGRVVDAYWEMCSKAQLCGGLLKKKKRGKWVQIWRKKKCRHTSAEKKGRWCSSKANR